ncbi:hypothetical protein JRO89_XS11G0025800 [Xanthoceras sorbifolium]|uniref:Ribosomal protein L4 n=1 Tax=Xanthoceras sorbifolium TaxID=99658 RepID=A0ABQ8HED5_9ROSI|nr:hypothetical protein JRO89_XS11G0025800 [Xanthoceras sorbifolium]
MCACLAIKVDRSCHGFKILTYPGLTYYRFLKRIELCAANSMATHVDMSLDDIIKSRKTSDRGRGQGRARRGRGPGGSFNGPRMAGPVRRGPLTVNARPSAYTIAKASSKLWMFYAYDETLISLRNSYARGSLTLF